MKSPSTLALVALLLLACLSSLQFSSAQVEVETADLLGDHAPVKEAAEAARAKVSPEELEELIKNNMVFDANLLPTRPPAKEYVPTGEPEFALLMSPGLGKGCNLKKYANLLTFLREEAMYYPDLLVDYQIAIDPKLKFFASKELRDGALVHGGLLSEDDILSLLQAGPDPTKEPLLNIELSDDDPEVKELMYILEQHGVKRAEQPDPDHSSQYIFKPDFKPIED